MPLKFFHVYIQSFLLYFQKYQSRTDERMVLHDRLTNPEIDPINIKKCYLQKGTRKMKGKAKQWKKMFAAHTTDKDLVSKMYKELIQPN